MKRLPVLLFFSLLLSGFSATAQNFRVQAAAFADSVSYTYFKDRGVEGVIVVVDNNGIYRYFVGSYATFDEAEKVRKDLVAKGFPKATVVDLEVQRALYEVPCNYFTGNPTADPSMGNNVRNIYFESGSAALDPEARRELDGMAQVLRENPELKLQLTGHTDAKGSAEANLQLASTRLRVVRDYLIARGVAAERLFLKVYGESKPVVDNQDFYGNDLPQNRKWNRRVSMAIIDAAGEVEE